MRVLRSLRWLVLAAFLSLIPASSYAGVFISVGFAPPVMPVYEQPPCPEEGWNLNPGYWAYGDDGYYWVPGSWVPAPYEDALWTPPYWGWQENAYVFHPGYWGRHVGYYGGINYGFGYFGIGFVGGEWHEHHFRYNTAVVNVNRTVIRNVYVNKTVVNNVTVVNNNRVAYAGGPGGIRHDPTQSERVAMHERHEAPTQIQQQHFEAARSERANYFKANNGRPQTVAVPRPMPAPRQPVVRGAVNGNPRGNVQPNGIHGNAQPATPGRVDGRPAPMPQPNSRPAYQQPTRPESQPRPMPQPQQNRPLPQPNASRVSAALLALSRRHGLCRSRSKIVLRRSRIVSRLAGPPPPQPQPRGDSHSAPQPQYRPAPQPRPESRPQPEYRPAPQPRPEPQSRPAPQPQYRPAPQPQYRAPQARPEPPSRPAPQARPEPQSRPQPHPDSRPESRPHR